MSTYKIYQIIDANKSTYSFRLPDSKKHVDFTSLTFGSKFADGKLTYGTDDPEIQKAIENLPKFKSGVITIEKEVKQQSTVNSQQSTVNKNVEIPVVVPPVVVEPVVETPVVETPVVVPPVVVEPVVETPVVVPPVLDNEVVEGPTTAQEAKDWLKTQKGIAPVALNSIDKVKAQAEKAGVTFPNVVWPE